jgi:hypothetical protein
MTWKWPWHRSGHTNCRAAQEAAATTAGQQQVVREELAPAAARMEQVVRRGRRELDRLAIEVTKALGSAR